MVQWLVTTFGTNIGEKEKPRNVRVFYLFIIGNEGKIGK